MKRIHLLGNLGEKFGPLWRANCSTVSEALRLIECQCPDFKKYLIDVVEQGTNFAVRTGEELLETGEELFMNVTEDDVYITEVPVGSGGWGKIIVGAILIIGAIAITLATGGGAAAGLGAAFAQVGATYGVFAQVGIIMLASIGLNLIMAGVNELLMPKPDKGKQGGAFFSGPINTIKQGQPVPLLYGELIVGGAPISVAYTKSRTATTGYVYSDATAGPAPAGTTSTSNPYTPNPQEYAGNYIGDIDSLPNLDLIRESLANFNINISFSF
jgi:predicted phage tail protein